MFIKLNFLSGLGIYTERIIKISRIKEVRRGHDKNNARVLMDKESRFADVQESVDEIFGIIKPKKKGLNQ